MIARSGDPKAIATKNIELLVTREQARLVKLAGDLSGGKLHLILRGMNDDSSVDAKDLFDPTQAEHAIARDNETDRDANRKVPIVEPKEPLNPAKPVSRKWKIEIIAGSDRRTEEVDLPEEDPVTLNTTTSGT